MTALSIAHRLEEFRAFIASTYGLSLMGDLRADGQFHGLKTDQDRHGGRPFRYCVHLDEPQNIYFTDLKRGLDGVWFPAGQEPLSPAERERLRQEAEARRVQREAEIKAYQFNAASKARMLWGRALPAPPDHPYLVKKGVRAHGIRFLPEWETWHEPTPGKFTKLRIKGVLLVPMRDETGELHNVQAIFPALCPELGRDKDFPPRARKKGLFHWIGPRTETVCLAEGYATAATIHEATGYRCIVCFDAGNLPIVAETVRGMLPDVRIVVCADHDKAGLSRATEAAERVGGFIAVPPVPGADFNDWAHALNRGHHGE